MDGLVEMVVESVRVHMLSNRHVVILKDVEGSRYLPIWIGAWEASAIAMRLQGLTAERPLTHDLFATALERLAVRIDRVVISELAEETYHARLYLERDGIEVEIDARPSDALALAVRGDVPIFAAEGVLEQAALGGDPDAEDVEGDEEPAEGDAATGGEGGGATPGRPGRRRIPLERVGDGIVDPRLDLFRDFVNSLDTDPGSGGGGGGSGPAAGGSGPGPSGPGAGGSGGPTGAGPAGTGGSGRSG